MRQFDPFRRHRPVLFARDVFEERNRDRAHNDEEQHDNKRVARPCEDAAKNWQDRATGGGHQSLIATAMRGAGAKMCLGAREGSEARQCSVE
jgi:hypothetical protein